MHGKKLIAAIVVSSVASLAPGLASIAHAQDTDPSPGSPPEPAPTAPPPVTPPYIPDEAPIPQQPSTLAQVEPEEMSEGRRIVVAYNTGFQWGLSPGVILGSDKASFFLGLHLGYGFDTGKAILVPGVRLSAYFTDPNVYVGMPVLKLVYPIDRFAPFVEAGAGYGYIAGFTAGNVDVPAETGLAIFGAAGFMIHFSWKFGLGVEGTYQAITGTEFHGFGIGPIIALSF